MRGVYVCVFSEQHALGLSAGRCVTTELPVLTQAPSFSAPAAAPSRGLQLHLAERGPVSGRLWPGGFAPPSGGPAGGPAAPAGDTSPGQVGEVLPDVTTWTRAWSRPEVER